MKWTNSVKERLAEVHLKNNFNSPEAIIQIKFLVKKLIIKIIGFHEEFYYTSRGKSYYYMQALTKEGGWNFTIHLL